LVEVLVAIEGHPWAEWKAGKAITANGLARLLAPFQIKPSTIRTSSGTPKGYSDILWRSTSGDVAIWLMNGLTPVSTADFDNVANVWTIVGVAAD
jgi:Protein of unknown function (DUF3631)